MKPFRTSFTARAFTAGAAAALIGAGLIATLGLPAFTIPIAILLPIALGLIGLFVGVLEYPKEVTFLVIFSPILFWIFVGAALLVIEKFPAFGWILVALGAVPLGLFIVSLGTREEAPATKPSEARIAPTIHSTKSA